MHLESNSSHDRQKNSLNGSPVDLKIAHGKWSHSHEEDHDGMMVFRPESFHFPRSRGRLAFVLEGDGHATYVPVGADDRSGAEPAQWSVEICRSSTPTLQAHPVISPGTAADSATRSVILRIQVGNREVLCAHVLMAAPEELLLRMLPQS